MVELIKKKKKKMCIYVNEGNEIVSIDEKPNYYFRMFEVEQSKSEMFEKLCNYVI